MKDSRFGLAFTIALVSGVGYIGLVQAYGDYASLAPPWVNALAGVAISFCMITLFGVYERNFRGVSE